VFRSDTILLARVDVSATLDLPPFSQINSGPLARGDSSLAVLFTCNLGFEKFDGQM